MKSNNFQNSQFTVGESSNNVEWSYEENRLFEEALAEQVEVVGSQAFFQDLATKFPYKSMEDIMIHFEALVKDVEMMQSDHLAQDTRTLTDDLMEESDDTNERRYPSVEPRRTSSVHRRRGIRWTEEEHQLFLMGLNKYGKGDWRSISRYYVSSKTPMQIASHAQKYFRRQTSTTPMERRRPSIHDIQTVASVKHPDTYMALPTFTANSSSAPAPIQMAFQFQTTAPLMNNPISGISTNLEPTPAMFVPYGHFNSTTYLMNNSVSGVGTSFEQTPTMFPPYGHFNSTTYIMNNSVSGVGTNLEETPAMFPPYGHFNTGQHMHFPSMNNQPWG